MKFEKVNAATGAAGPGFSRGTEKYAGNQHMKTNSDAMINKGRGPTVGNTSNDKTPGTGSMPKATPGKEMTMGCHNPQVRNPGGTRAFDPKAGQNYKGNADSIDMGRGPTKGNA